MRTSREQAFEKVKSGEWTYEQFEDWCFDAQSVARQDGYNDGRNDGYDSGYNDGCESGDYSPC